jgi:hypothetical protein
VAQVEVAERAAGRDVGERPRFAVAPRLVAELAREFRDAFVDLAPLARDPFVALQRGGPPALDHDRRCRVADAVGERFPLLDGDALARRLRDQPRHRAHEVDVLDDDARIVEMRAVVEDQHRQLAERVVRVQRVAGCPARRLDRLVLDLLFGEHDAHLARIRARRRSDQFQHGKSAAEGWCGGRRV